MVIKVNRIECINYDEIEIPVEYLLIHYTALNLQQTISIFLNKRAKVSCHLIIDKDGAVYELVDCLKGMVYKAWHAGGSLWTEKDKEYSGFNRFSIGIELINYNGNVFPYTEAQYQKLFKVIQQLQINHPNLLNPNRILGHEHVAGYRGKCDPGHCFDWEKLYKSCFSNSVIPERKPTLPFELCASLERLKEVEPQDYEEKSAFWGVISEYTESVLKLYHDKPL